MEREISILGPGDTKIFPFQESRDKIQIMKGVAQIQEWQPYGEGKMRQGGVRNIPHGEFFFAGGTKTVVLFNTGKETLEYQKLRELPLQQQMQK